jgi:hypothetical protein
VISNVGEEGEVEMKGRKIGENGGRDNGVNIEL